MIFAEIYCVLGADMYPLIVEDGLIKSKVKLQMAQKTTLGWILMGSLSSKISESVQSNAIFHCYISVLDLEPSNSELADQLNKFWHVESVSSEHRPLTEEEEKCEKHFL